MALVRPEGTSWIDAGLARRGLSLIGNVQQRTGLAIQNGTTTNEEVLYTSNLPIGLLNADGKGLLITIWVTTTNNGNNKRVKIYMPAWGTGIVVADTGLFGNAIANNASVLMVYVFRTGPNSQDVFGYDMSNQGAGGTVYNALTLNSKSGIQFVVVGKNSASLAGDIVLRSVSVALLTEGAVMTAGGVLQ